MVMSPAGLQKELKQKIVNNNQEALEDIGSTSCSQQGRLYYLKKPNNLLEGKWKQIEIKIDVCV